MAGPNQRSFAVRLLQRLVLVLLLVPSSAMADSVARQWNEEILSAIRQDFARPTVHARNLYHLSVAMWDAWAAFDPDADQVMHFEKFTVAATAAARDEAISYAAYRVLTARFADSPGAAATLPALEARMEALGYHPDLTVATGTTPAAIGNRIAATVLAAGAVDGSNEANGYASTSYEPVNDPLDPIELGNPDITDPNRWQPLEIESQIDQSGQELPGNVAPFLGPEWGQVTPFALSPADKTTYMRGGFDYIVHHDPGAPPQLDGLGGPDDLEYKDGFLQVLEFSAELDPASGTMIDISPASRGNNTLGTNDGSGYTQNPATTAPYAPQTVPAGDYYRVLAEFWADGPDSETPPGHWYTIANYVSDHPMLEKKIGGTGPVVGDLEWDVKVYLALGGAVHDAAISAWGVKGWYDYVRPISAIRYMAGKGQSSDMLEASYDPEGIPLVPGLVEVVKTSTIQLGERHAHLGPGAVGKIAVNVWRGPGFIANPEVDTAGVGWILAEFWWPYQRPNFVTPPFAGYVSGHSTFSRAAARIMSEITGDEFFPGGLGEFTAAQNDFLVFEQGPSVNINLQWAKYYDAADECSLSRIYGGIHPRADDIPGRLMGHEIGGDAWALASQHFDGTAHAMGGAPVAVPATDGPAAVLLSLALLMLAGRLLPRESH